MAAQQELGRSQLEEWDASARAWLRIADEVKKKQQTQVRLIVDSLERTSVNTNPILSDSVLNAWKDALEQMESQVKGEPQRSYSGGILLALLSWHLYPNLVVMNESYANSVDVRQHDHLLEDGNVLTIGLQRHEENRFEEKGGIAWSLPLAHLRYYGQPVLSSATMNGVERSRLTIEELLYAALGCILQHWSHDFGIIEQLLKILKGLRVAIHEAVAEGNKNAENLVNLEGGQSWLMLVLDAAHRFLSLQDREKSVAKKLILLGSSKGSGFLSRPTLTLFGMLKSSKCLSMLQEEDRILMLREIATEMKLKPHETFIRYRRDPAGEREVKDVYDYATALPVASARIKRDLKEGLKACPSHIRWLSRKTRLTWEQGGEVSLDEEFRQRQNRALSAGEQVYDGAIYATYVPELIRDMSLPDAFGSATTDYSRYHFLFGDTDTAALYSTTSVKEPRLSVEDNEKLGIRILQKFYQNGRLNPHSFVDVLSRSIYNEHRLDVNAAHIDSLRNLASAVRIYTKMDNSSVDVRVLRCPLLSAKWGTRREGTSQTEYARRSGSALASKILDRRSVLSCLCMFESGRFNINPEDINNAIAMSSENSLFIASSVLQDPGEPGELTDVRRVIGNVGRAGIAFLVLPQDPMVREQDLAVWPLLDNAVFDSRRIDCFKGTSLHLSFTGLTFPIEVGAFGQRDVEVYKLESVVSVHDRGKWVADLDVTHDYSKYHANLPDGHEHEHTKDTSALTAIDSWEEMLEFPLMDCVFRAHGNWQARLAAASIYISRGGRLIKILPQKEVCWKCCCMHWCTDTVKTWIID